MVPLLIALGAVSLLVLATTVAALRARRWARSLPRTFRCKLTLDSESGRIAVRWPRRTSQAVWINDVLLLYSGFWYHRARPYHVHFAEDLYSCSSERVSGLGPAPIVLPVELNDGRRALVAASRGSEEVLAGPFCAAALRRRFRSQSAR